MNLALRVYDEYAIHVDTYSLVGYSILYYNYMLMAFTFSLFPNPA